MRTAGAQALTHYRNLANVTHPPHVHGKRKTFIVIVSVMCCLNGLTKQLQPFQQPNESHVTTVGVDSGKDTWMLKLTQTSHE